MTNQLDQAIKKALQRTEISAMQGFHRPARDLTFTGRSSEQV